MTWFKVDDTLATHPKAYMAGNKAIGLWVRAGAWSSSQLSDGFVPRSVLSALGATKADADKLVTAGLWSPGERDGDQGYQFHQWAERNPTRAEVEDKREKEAEKKRRQRSKGHLNVVHDERGRFSPKDQR